MADKIPYDLILDAKLGIPEAMASVLRHYGRYIASVSRRVKKDASGCPHLTVDEDIMNQIQQELMLKIIYVYDPLRFPEGETIDC